MDELSLSVHREFQKFGFNTENLSLHTVSESSAMGGGVEATLKNFMQVAR